MKNGAASWFALSALVVAGVLCLPSEAMAQRCPPGYRFMRFRGCVPFAVRPVVRPMMCPRGYVLGPGGRCAPAVLPARACPPGYYFFRGRCLHR